MLFLSRRVNYSDFMGRELFVSFRLFILEFTVRHVTGDLPLHFHANSRALDYHHGTDVSLVVPASVNLFVHTFQVLHCERPLSVQKNNDKRTEGVII